MATANPFDLLGGDDNDDPSQLIAAVQLQKVAPTATAGGKKAPATGATAAKPAKLPSKPAPPSEAVRELRNEGGRGGGRGAGRGNGRGRGGYYRDSRNDDGNFGNENGFPGGDMESGKSSERRPYSGPRGGFRGGRRGGFSNGEAVEGERPRRQFDRRSGTGRGGDIKRDGGGRRNWGTPADDIAPATEEPAVENETDAAVVLEKVPNEEENVDGAKENPANEAEEKEPEETQMTLEEYEKVLEEKRKALLPSKAEERKVDTKEFETMQMISKKKYDDEVFIKLGSEKDRRREAAEKEERAKKSVSINEFLKPAEGEGYYRSGGRGRGRGRGSRGGYGGGNPFSISIPKIEDPGQFPTLGA